MKEIQLTKGKFAKVDDDMYEELNQYKWYTTSNEYAAHDFESVTVLMHRFITNCPKDKQVDHINGDKLDNRKENLRIATSSQNNFNMGVCRANTSGYKGVYWCKQKRKWHARIQVNRKNVHLGFYENKVDAAKAYNKGALKYAGEFAKLNVINEEESA